MTRTEPHSGTAKAPDATLSAEQALRVAAIVPCYNEGVAIATVVCDLAAALPGAEIYVYDNNSTDDTAEVARRAGATVRTEPRKGKGNVVRRAFADIEADVYVIIDGDDTYDASRAGDLVLELVSGPFDHVLGVRTQASATAYRPGHAVGNRMLNRITSALFGEPVTDMLSGYRAFSRRFVKSFPAQSREFEIETELTVHATSLRIPQSEVPVGFKDRPAGTESKLRTYRDGIRVMGTIAKLAHYVRPVLVYAVMAGLLAVTSLALGLPVVGDYLETGLVLKFPTAILAAALATISVLTFMVGILQAAVKRSRDENARLWYLSLPALRPDVAPRALSTRSLDSGERDRG